MKPQEVPRKSPGSIFSITTYGNRGVQASTEVDIPLASKNLYFKYEFVLHTPATAAWLTRTNKSDMVLPDSNWSCEPPAYQFLS